MHRAFTAAALSLALLSPSCAELRKCKADLPPPWPREHELGAAAIVFSGGKMSFVGRVKRNRIAIALQCPD